MRPLLCAALALCFLNGCALLRPADTPLQMVYANTTETGFSQSVAVRSRDGQTVRFPLRLQGGLPTVSCLINGEEATMLIDSGSSIFGVFRGRARRLGIAPIAGLEVPAQTSGGLGMLTVGSAAVLVFHPWMSMKIDAPVLLDREDPIGEIDAILGGPALAMLNAVIDYQNRELVFLASIDKAREFSEEMKIAVGEFEGAE